MHSNLLNLKSGLLVCALLCILVQSKLLAQGDPQYTQFYANSLYLNPAFAGANGTSRAFMIGRLQWPSIDGTHVTGTASFDHHFDQINSGVGLLVTQDYIPTSGLKSLDIGVQYAYHLNLTEKLTFRPGVQLGLGRRSIDFSKLNYGNQYTDRGGYSSGAASGENFSSSTVPFYPDIAAGGLFYTNNAWVGIASHHLNKPIMSFNGADDGADANRIAMKTTLHAGMKFLVGNQGKPRYGVVEDGDDEKSISPTMIYKTQGKWDQLDLGMYGRYSMLVVGFWYRGIPIKRYKSEISNHDAMNFLVGFIYNSFNLGYSYDLTISKLGMQSGGSHELSLTYTWLLMKHPKKKMRREKVVCPKF